MVSAQKIKYNGVFSDTGLDNLDLVLDVAFDSDNGAMSSYLNRSAVVSESYDGRYKNTHRYKYDELFSPQFTIVKKDFSDFSQLDIRKLLKYLTSTDKPALLEVYYADYADGDIAAWACIGGWTSIETYKIANSRTIGVVAKFEAITPYAMSNIISHKKTIPSTNDVTARKMIIDVDTDDNKPIYPRITVTHTGSSVVKIPTTTQFNNVVDMAYHVENTLYYNGSTYYLKTPGADPDQYSFWSGASPKSIDTTSVRIINKHYAADNVTVLHESTMVIKNNTLREEIIIDGTNKVISSTNTSRIIGDDFENWAWLPLYDGKNELIIEGNCTITIDYREVRKVGEY